MYRTVFTVAGQGGFPLDMLRYDRCFPLTSQDVRDMDQALRHPSFARNQKDLPSVTLCSYHDHPEWEVDIRRWVSFGWMPTEIHPAELAD